MTLQEMTATELEEAITSGSEGAVFSSNAIAELADRVRAIEALEGTLVALERARRRTKDQQTARALSAVCELVRLQSPARRQILRGLEI